MDDEQRAALGAEFQRIVEGGLEDHLIKVEKQLFVRLLNARTQRTSRQIRAQILAVQHVGAFIVQTIADGEVTRSNLKTEKQINEGERVAWH